MNNDRLLSGQLYQYVPAGKFSIPADLTSDEFQACDIDGRPFKNKFGNVCIQDPCMFLATVNNYVLFLHGNLILSTNPFWWENCFCLVSNDNDK